MVLGKRASGEVVNRRTASRGDAPAAAPEALPLPAREVTPSRWPALSGCENSALPLGPADHALGDQGIDLARGISEFAEHFARMRAEGRRGAAQARLAALHADGGGDPLVPILFDDVAAMDGVRAGQRLIDRLHRPGRQPGR